MAKGGDGETVAVPQGRAGRRDSSLRSSAGFAGCCVLTHADRKPLSALPASLPRAAHRTPATSTVPPSPPPVVATYSIVACDLAARQWSVAVQSKFLAVGSVVPWAEPEVGAIATQAYANPRYGPNGLALLRDGLDASEVVARLTAEDEGRDERQLGVVDGQGAAASWTGPGCNDWAGHQTGPGYAAQGNILVGEETVAALATTFEANSQLPLAERLIECLAAAQAAGGDRRGQQSASLLVVQKDGGYAGLSDVLVDLRVDDHERPIEELRRLYRLHDLLFGISPREDWLPLEGQLRSEVDERLARLGYDSLDAWAGVENLEERVDGDDAIDPVVLDALRKAGS
jgi:uncharacterized Ntn-hydrolase superfamily protein